MPTKKHLGNFPSFPDGLQTINLPRISLNSLLSGDEAEAAALFQASAGLGFFLLDLRETTVGENLLREAKTAFDTSRTFYAWSTDEKGKFPLLPSNLGYKAIGRTKIENGKPDCCEIYGVSQDDLLGLSEPRSNPEPFEVNRPVLKSCIKNMHSVTKTILDHLSKHLDLPPDTLSSMHSPSISSPSCLRFLHMPPQPPAEAQTSLVGHTDNGSVTILFNILGGLQILPPGLDGIDAKNWRWVRPEPGCAVINFGDSMVQWTGGVIRSNMHRVVPPPGEQAQCERFSLAYALKPPGNASMKRLKGGTVIPVVNGNEDEVRDCTYDEFHKKKSKGITEGKNLAGTRGGVKGDQEVGVNVKEVVA
ncbi:hypothetical protein P7C71_g3159, partial [Lecanoromycetidae sp. Uapishka_2]